LRTRKVTRVRSKFSVVAVVAAIVIGISVFAFSRDTKAAMPTGDLPGWKQTSVQDFDKPAALGEVGRVYGDDMRGYDGLRDTSRRGVYSPDSVLSVADGKLDYFLHTANGSPRVAAPIPFGYSGQTYGRYSVRFRSDYLPGYKIAFMLWPTSDDWNDGEIDWPEGNLNRRMYGGSAIKGSMNDEGLMKFDPARRRPSPTDSSKWHVATTEWTPGKIKWFWDDKLVSETSIPDGVPDTNFRWTLQAETEVGEGARVPEPDTSGHLEIDWVVQYAYAPND
jgi:hypothetical protein